MNNKISGPLNDLMAIVKDSYHIISRMWGLYTRHRRFQPKQWSNKVQAHFIILVLLDFMSKLRAFILSLILHEDTLTIIASAMAIIYHFQRAVLECREAVLYQIQKQWWTNGLLFLLQSGLPWASHSNEVQVTNQDKH